MSATLAPQGLVPSHHPSGVIRVTNQGDGIASAYGTSIYTGTPIMRGTDGTIIVVPTGASTPIGVFQGCEFSSASKRFVLPYWPAAQTYDAGSMIAKYTDDPEIIYEGQANGAVAMTAVGEGINLGDASQGSVYTGFSTQSLAATTTGATAASFILQGLAPYPGNAWGDAYTRVYVKISTRQGQVA
jgi:hypothetical protein